MLARLVLGAVTAAVTIVPALAGMLNADEARRFVNGKVFAFTCFDGTRGAGRILDDLGAAGSIQFSGSGPIRNVRLPGNTLQIRGQVNNCSIYLQRYWIDFSEPTNTNTDCKAAFSVFPTTVWSSGSTQSWSASRTITNAPTTSPQDCVGEHTLNAVLRSRTDGSVLDTASITYTVSL